MNEVGCGWLLFTAIAARIIDVKWPRIERRISWLFPNRSKTGVN